MRPEEAPPRSAWQSPQCPVSRRNSETQKSCPCAPVRTESRQRSAPPCDDLTVRGTPAGTPPNTRRFRLRRKSAPARSRKYCHSPPRAVLPDRSASQTSHLRAAAQIPCDACPARSAIAPQTYARDTTPPVLPDRSASQTSHLRAAAQIPCDACPARSAIAPQTYARDTTPPAPPVGSSLRRPRDVPPAAPA